MPPRSDAPADPMDLASEVQLGGSAKTRAANDAIRALARASRSYLIYDPNNAAIRGFLEDVKNSFDRYTQQYGDMDLAVRPFELMLEGEPVYLERDRERSLALKLFRDGVRKLVIEAGVDWGELIRLLEILSIRFVGIRQNEDDIVTLLWKAGFSRIRVEAVEGFVPDEDPVEENVARSVGPGGSVRPAARVGDAASARVPVDFDLPAPKLPAPVAVSFRALTDDVREALVAEEGSNLLPELTLTAVTEVLAAVGDPTDPLGFRDMTHFVREIRDFLLAEARLDQLLALQEQLAHFRERHPRERDAVDEVLGGFVDERALTRLVHSVPHDAQEPPEALFRLLAKMGTDPLPILLDHLANERSEHARRVLRLVIERFLPARQTDVVARLRQSGGGVAADLLRVLAHGAPEAAQAMLTSLVNGGDPEVQLEFLRLAAEMPPGSQVRSLLVMMLHASDEDVRVQTLETIAARRERGAFATVLKYGEGRFESGASARELEALGETLARVDPERALEAFEQWVQPRGFFQKLFRGADVPPRVRAAVSGLAALDAPEAEASLLTLAARGEEGVRAVARAALAKRRGEGAKP